MSAVWFKLITILCLSCSALSDPESSRVVWRDAGGDVTIQCRSPGKNQEILIVRKGLKEDIQVLYSDGKSAKNTAGDTFENRLQTNGKFPNISVLITNLSSEDTGPFWCIYRKFDLKSAKTIFTRGEGSVLLVVRDSTCDQSDNKNQVLVSVVICAAVLLAAIICFIVWIILIKTKTLRTTKKQRQVPTNDVYEDMRGTIRR